MKSVRFSTSFVAIALCLAATGTGSATITPTSADRQAFELGIRQQNAINIFSDPKECGIVLMRPYCKDAVAVLAGSSTPPANVERFVDTGNIDYYDKSWAEGNAIAFTAEAWKASARETWLRAAGAMYAASYTPNWDQYSMMQVPVYRNLVEYASDADPYGSLISDADIKSGASGVGIDGPARIAKYLVPALTALFPTQAEPALDVATGHRGAAQLGVYVSTAQEMFESPVLFLALPRGLF
jgi:hypothetical protein